MVEKNELEVGMGVKVFPRNTRGVPADGYEGMVESVGRKFLTIGWSGGRKKFLIEEQCTEDKFNGMYRFKTLEQADLDARRDAVMLTLKSAGLLLTYGCSLTLDQLEACARLIQIYSSLEKPQDVEEAAR